MGWPQLRHSPYVPWSIRSSALCTSVSNACSFTRRDCSCWVSRKSTATSSKSCGPSLASMGSTGFGCASVNPEIFFCSSSRFASSRDFMALRSMDILHILSFNKEYCTVLYLVWNRTTIVERRWIPGLCLHCDVVGRYGRIYGLK